MVTQARSSINTQPASSTPPQAHHPAPDVAPPSKALRQLPRILRLLSRGLRLPQPVGALLGFEGPPEEHQPTVVTTISAPQRALRRRARALLLGGLILRAFSLKHNLAAVHPIVVKSSGRHRHVTSAGGGASCLSGGVGPCRRGWGVRSSTSLSSLPGDPLALPWSSRR